MGLVDIIGTGLLLFIRALEEDFHAVGEPAGDVLQLEAGEEGQDSGEVLEVVAEAFPFVHDVAAVLGFEAGGVVVAEVAGGEDDADDFFGAAAVRARVDRDVFHREGEVFHADAGDGVPCFFESEVLEHLLDACGVEFAGVGVQEAGPVAELA